MYHMLKSVQQDSRSTEEYRKALANYIKTEFLSGKDSDRSAAYRAMDKKQVPASMYAAYLECAKLNVDDIKASISKNNFHNSYSKVTYILPILERYTSETVTVKSDFDPREMY